MSHQSFPFRTARSVALASTVATALLASAPVLAQQVYRIVGPDGKVTFSDRAPEPGKAQVEARARGGGAGPSSAGLPYALQQVVARYPVTLYTSADCTPCASARSLLQGRGVPFRERTVSSNQDIEALKALTGGEASVPFATIGQQQLRGFNDAEWTQYLDLAGYPKQSQLPASYRPTPPSPLVPAQPAPATATAAPDQQEQAPPPAAAPAPAPGPSPSNPAGLVF